MKIYYSEENKRRTEEMEERDIGRKREKKRREGRERDSGRKTKKEGKRGREEKKRYIAREMREGER